MTFRITLDRSKKIELVVIALALAGLAFIGWRWLNGAPLWFYYAYIVVSVAVGLTLYFTLPKLDQPLRRRLVLVLLGASLFGAAAFRDSRHGLFQIEGLFFDLLTGVWLAAVIHYLIAKIIGPLLFGRVWCGWGCWTATLLDQLPYKRGKGRLPGRWGMLRYAHVLASLGLVATLWYGFAYRPGDGGPSALAWFLGGNALYYLVGVTLALLLKDNRAFCKYVCPVAVPLKLSSRFALLKVNGDASKCCERRVCEKICPMDIRIADYIGRGERVLSSECILCQACLSVCPEQALTLSFGLDAGGLELLREREGS
ncbi:MAG TPA: 4Fe-4S binding protein [Roseiflexaceae bacterium]|nr:4Fe-4S binding protein [Roseiflexaceae bacterium]